MSEKTTPLNIVVLGASFAGLSVAHHFLDHTVFALGKTSRAPTYRLVIISPSTHIYWNIAAPRALVAPDLIKDSEAFVPIEPAFSRHDAKSFVFLQGLAVSWDPEARLVHVQAIGSKARKTAARMLAQPALQERFPVPYHALVLATGSSAHCPLLSLHGPHQKTMAALRRNHELLRTASSVVVGGGGPSGVETAGQLATYLDIMAEKTETTTTTKKKKRKKTGRQKHITLVMGTSRALPRLPAKVGLKAEKQLVGIGVEIIREVRVVEALEGEEEEDEDEEEEEEGDGGNVKGKTRVVLSNGETLLTDVYIAATGVTPNTAFVPNGLLDAEGYVVTDGQSLRVAGAGAGERVYALGDCASYSANNVPDTYVAVRPLMANLEKDLWAWELRDANPYGGSEDDINDRKDAVLEMAGLVTSQLCPITRRGGVGVLFGVRVPSLIVYLLKGRDYSVGRSRRVVVDGDDPY